MSVVRPPENEGTLLLTDFLSLDCGFWWVVFFCRLEFREPVLFGKPVLSVGVDGDRAVVFVLLCAHLALQSLLCARRLVSVSRCFFVF